MSDIETHRGKMVPVVLSGVTLEERAENACKKYGFERTDWHDSWYECLRDNGYRKVYFDEDTEVLYELQDEELDSLDIAEGTKNPDGSIDYIISWYNGGASMDEVLDSVMEKVNKK